MSVLNESQIVGSSGQGSGYDITDSLRFRASANAYLNRTPSSASNQKTWTWSSWVKRGAIADGGVFGIGTSGSYYFNIRYQPDYISVVSETPSNVLTLRTNALYRDPSAWYHIMFVLDTTQSTASNRAKLYINGEQVTSFSSTTYPSLNADLIVNSVTPHYLGALGNSTTTNLDGYMTEVNFVDGTAKAPSDFGESDSNGTWIPKKYLGTYGTNGFYLPIKPTTQATGFNTVLYTGNGGTQSITGVGFEPDLVWVKNRDESSRFNLLTDTIRGATKSLASNLNSAESGTTYSTGLTAFGTDGFSVGSLIDFNGSADKMVAWCWQAETTTAKTYTVKVVSDGGNKYRFDDFGSSAVTLDLHESGTYTFDQSDSSNSGHPFRFSTTSGGTHSGGSAYTTGVTVTGTPGSAGAKTVIVVAASAPTLYYYCTVHSGMGGQANTNATKGSSNFKGTIKSTVSANSSTGFSIATWTNNSSGDDTVGHGLGVAPKLIITKLRSTSGDWYTHTTAIDGGLDYLKLNDTNAAASLPKALPTADVFTTDMGGTTTAVAYSFADVAGYQKIDKYTGNGSTTGPTITGLGFQPAWILIKSTSIADEWVIFDNTRNPSNPTNLRLNPNSDGTEQSSQAVNILSDGFQPITTGGNINQSGATYIYMAIADTRDEKFNFDASGNKNNWTANNINSNASGDSSYDLMSDVPTLTDEDTSNFATLNPNNMAVNTTMTDGNLKASNSSNHATMFPTNMPTTGKYYFECKMAVNATLGLGFRTDTNKVESAYSDEANKYYFYLNNSNAYRIVETTNTALGSNLNSTSSTFQVAIDFDAAKYYFGVNNTWYAADWGTDGDPASGANPSYDLTDGTKMFPFVYVAGGTWTVNFGQRPFAYTPPTGFKKLNTFNLPDSTITDGSEHFDIQLWTGDNANPRSFSNTAFSPDLVWYKSRNTAYYHNLYDSVRGVTKTIYPNATSAEYVNDSSGTLKSFDSDGFTVGGDSDVTTVNGTGQTYVGWQWRGSDSTAASNSAGSITSTVSANPTAGFSVVTYTGTGSNATVGHGLGVAPKFLIVKDRDAAEGWMIQSQIITGNTNGTFHFNTDAEYTGSSTAFQGTIPTSTVFSIGTAGNTNNNTQKYVAYCFAEVDGYSKMGTYAGNGSADGTFIYTGFRPAFFMFRSTILCHWVILDTARNSFNVAENTLYPDEVTTELSSASVLISKADFLSNGIKWRNTLANESNASGQTYVYMAFAENPFKNSNAR